MYVPEEGVQRMSHISGLHESRKKGTVSGGFGYFPVFLGSGKKKRQVLCGDIAHLKIFSYKVPGDIERVFRGESSWGSSEPVEVLVIYRDERAVRLPRTVKGRVMAGHDGVFIGPGNQVTRRAEFGDFLRQILTGEAKAPVAACVEKARVAVKAPLRSALSVGVSAVLKRPNVGAVVKPEVGAVVKPQAGTAVVKLLVVASDGVEHSKSAPVTVALVSCGGLPGSAEETAKAMSGLRVVVVALEAETESAQTATTSTMAVSHYEAIMAPSDDPAQIQRMAGGPVKYPEQTDCDRGAMRVVLDALTKEGKLTPREFEREANKLASANGSQRVRLLTQLQELYHKMERELDVLKGASATEAAGLRRQIRGLRQEAGELLAARRDPPRVRVVANEEGSAAGLLDRDMAVVLKQLDRAVVELLAGPQEDQAQIGVNFDEQLAVIEAGLKDPAKCLRDLLADLRASGGTALEKLMIASGRTCAMSGEDSGAGKAAIPRSREASDAIRAGQLAHQLIVAGDEAVLSRLLGEKAAERVPQALVGAASAAVLAEVKLEWVPCEVLSVVEYLCGRCLPERRDVMPETLRRALRRVLLRAAPASVGDEFDSETWPRSV
jgi:hypothetical protein